MIDEALARQRFAELLREVPKGAAFVATSRGRPVARITPIDDLTRQADRIDVLLDFVATPPRRGCQDWRREELYE